MQDCLLLFFSSSREPSYHDVVRLACLRKRGEADGVVVEGERAVDVLQERVAEQPDVAAEAEVLASERTDALAGAALGLTEVEAGRSQKVISD